MSRCSNFAAFVVLLFQCLLLSSNAQENRHIRTSSKNGAFREYAAAINHIEHLQIDPVVYRPEPVLPSSAQQDPNVIFVPRLGLVRGQMDFKRIRNRGINAFRNIKYARVRSGLGRFQQATPVMNDLSNNIILATDVAPNCAQFPDLPFINISEVNGGVVDDCLSLNIYAPNKPGLYPVIVFVHGEMLFDGTAEEGQPDYFLEHDVVLVTVNYRLAPFGFLTTLTDEMPGNVALSDLQLALEWIHHYIRAFGGNRDQVTLLGQAGGATLVHALSLSNRTQGLFHKLILQSGTALNPYFLDEDPITTARSFARLARCPLAKSGRVLQALHECFERLSTLELLRLMEQFWDTNEPRGLRFVGGFKLVVGDRFGFLEEHPAALISHKNHPRYPLLAGVTKDAGAFIMSRVMYTQLQQLRSTNISDYISIALRHTAQPRHYEIWYRLALDHIFDEEYIKNPKKNNLSILAQGLLELVNLILYRGPLIDSIRHTYRKTPTYLYCFDYRGEHHRFSYLSNPLPFATDATLSDDSIYLFPYPAEVSQLNAEDRTLSRALITMWVNFIEVTIPNLNNGIWPNVTTEYGPFVRFTNSKENTIELDYHFGEGIPIPNLYPEYKVNGTTTRRPVSSNYYLNYPYYAQHGLRPSYTYETALNDGEISLHRKNHPGFIPRQPYNGYSNNG